MGVIAVFRLASFQICQVLTGSAALAGMLCSVGAAPVVPARAVAPDRRAQVRAPGVSLRLRGDRRRDRRARHPARRSPHHRQNPDPLGGEVADHGVGRGPIPASRRGLDVRPVHRPAHRRGAALLQHQHIAAGDVLERVIEPEEARRGGGAGLRPTARRASRRRPPRLPVPELFGRRVSLQVKRGWGDASVRRSAHPAAVCITPRIITLQLGAGSRVADRRLAMPCGSCPTSQSARISARRLSSASERASRSGPSAVRSASSCRNPSMIRRLACGSDIPRERR